MTFPDPTRRQNALDRRQRATALSTQAPHPQQRRNPDEVSPYIFSFRKGLHHLDNGLLADADQFVLFREGTETADPDVFAGVPLNRDLNAIHTMPPGATVDSFREWESPTAGHAYVMQGPDPFALTIPPAPAAGSAELAAEMAELYQMALSRDWQIASFMDEALINALTLPDGSPLPAPALQRLQLTFANVRNAAVRLSRMRWFSGSRESRDTGNPEHLRRRRFGTPQTPDNIFRGIGEDPWPTPFLSQFMVMGSGGGGRQLEARASGIITYGNQRIDQKVKIAIPSRDYMTTWHDWLDVQNGLDIRNLRNRQTPCNEFQCGAGNEVQYRLMATLRDMATYVHDDQLYQAYFNAALILLNEGFPFDSGIPFHRRSATPGHNREPFALFGGPHLLTLVTEVSSRALKAVRLQKFSVHRRLRPEALAALFHVIYTDYDPNREVGNAPYSSGDGSDEAKARAMIGNTLATYTFPQAQGIQGSDPELENILTDIRRHNARNNGEDENDLNIAKWLLPMAFPEGSPMHPAYGAGHATVAGACVTLLKSFFSMQDPYDAGRPIYLVEPGERALVPDGGAHPGDPDISLFAVEIARGLTLEGELNKLMWNISNARNIAGVHYFTDYVESAVLGEDITIGILREQMAGYDAREAVSMTVPLLVRRSLPAALLGGGSIAPGQEVDAVRIDPDGHLHAAPPTPRS